MARYLVSVTVESDNVFGALLAASKQFVGDEVALLTLAQTGAIAVKLVRSRGESTMKDAPPVGGQRDRMGNLIEKAGAKWDLEHA